MREPWEWTENDLLDMIRMGAKESLTLDYKQSASLDKSDKKKDELCKDVSAFANSAGGVIVYGMVENNHLPIALDDGYDPTDIDREFIENVINSKIQRRIGGIRINQVALSGQQGRVAYVVSVPPSTMAPHIAPDKRFYKRFNFSSVPMEEYEIRDVSNRLVAPDLRVQLSMGGYVLSHGAYFALPFQQNEEWSSPLQVELAVTNESSTPAEYSVFELFVGETLTVNRYPGGFLVDNNSYITLDGWLSLRGKRYTTNHAIPGKMPIWKGPRWTITNEFYVSVPRQTGFHPIATIVHSARLDTRITALSLLIRDGSVHVFNAEAPHFH